MPKFSVQFSCVVEIEAKSEEEAEQIAKELFEQEHRMDWFWVETQQLNEGRSDNV